jgi:nucleosome assembly protein 1-like 1
MVDYDYEDKFQEELAKISSDSLKHKLVAIKNVIVRRLALEREFKSLHHKLESKYEALYKPIYDKRAKVIEGTQEVKAEDIAEQLSKLSLNNTTPQSLEKGIPEFWLKALKNTSQFGQLINKKDEKVLAHLLNITCDFKEDGSFILDFVFSPNEYFSHTSLQRTFTLDKEKQSISKIESTKIDWKSEDVNPTVEKKKKKIKSSNNNF